MRSHPSHALRAAVAAFPLLILGCVAGTNRGAASVSHPYVVMVSFDAFRADYIDRYHPRAIEELGARGVRAEALIPSFPSKTFPNHYTLVTGLYPGSHGITGNAFYDPKRSAAYRSGDSLAVRDGTWYGGEPIWVTAERNGVKSASYFWTGSEAAIGGIRPTYSEKYDGKVPNFARVDGVIAWLRKPAIDRPHLVLLYLSEVDDTTHKFGPISEHTAVAVAHVDRTLRRLMDSLRVLPFADSVNIVLVSDHGMADTPPTKVIALGDLMMRDGADTAGMVFSDNGPTMSLWLAGDMARARRLRDLLNRNVWSAHAYLLAEAPAAWHLADNPRFGDVLIVADEGYILQRKSSDKAPSLGNHGYDPYTVSSMRGIFLAAGPGVRTIGSIPAFENVAVYPFIVRLLHLERIPAVDGTLSTLESVLK